MNKEITHPSEEDCLSAAMRYRDVAILTCRDFEQIATKIYGFPCKAAFVIQPLYRLHYMDGETEKVSEIEERQMATYISQLRDAETDKEWAKSFKDAYAQQLISPNGIGVFKDKTKLD